MEKKFRIIESVFANGKSEYRIEIDLSRGAYVAGSGVYVPRKEFWSLYQDINVFL